MNDVWFIRAPSPLFYRQILVGIDLLPQYVSRGITVLD